MGLRFTCFSCCFTFFQIHTRLTITTMLKIECTVFCFFFWSTVILSLRQTAHPSGYRQHCTFSSPPLFVVPFGVFFFFFSRSWGSVQQYGCKLPDQEFEMQCLPWILVIPTYTPHHCTGRRRALKRTKQGEEKRGTRER